MFTFSTQCPAVFHCLKYSRVNYHEPAMIEKGKPGINIRGQVSLFGRKANGYQSRNGDK